MIKKSTVKGKRGAMLILVLLIVALAVILIGSALSMTRQTRARYYSYAEGSQSRLTATSIAESLWDAIYIQEIDDATVEEMANGKAKLQLSGLTVPGANGVSNGIVEFEPPKEGKIRIKCTATVGGTTTTVQLTLVQPEPTTVTNLFEHLVNLSGGSNITETNIGAGGSGASDNTILIQGDGVDINGSCDIDSTTFIQGVFKPQDNRFNADLVFWGPKAQMNLQGEPKLGGTNMGLYFVSNSTKQQSVLDNGANLDPNGEGKLSEFGLYNANFVMNKGNAFGNSDFILQKGIDSSASYSGSVVGAINSAPTTMSDAIIAKAKAYAEKDFTDHYPTIDEVSGAFGCSTTPTGTVVISGEYGAGNYIINGDVSGDLVFDIGGGDCTVYVTSNCYLSGSISFINGASNQYWGRIILSNGIDFTIGGAGAGIYSYENGKPHCFVYGMGNILFSIVENGPSYLEAYVGLYDSDSPSRDSKFYVEGSPDKFYFKGRLSAPLYEHYNGGHLNIPYCVDPTAPGSGDGKIYPIVTGFKVEPFVYFS
ncbi:MAG: hypothetical protein MJ153_01250 [Clostridia bacterium]|nr:hypothetical protein [Clostridia bacterium]